MLCKAMRERWDLVAITNDIYTKEDQRLLTLSVRAAGRAHPGRGNRRLPAHPPSAKDCSINLEAIDRMLAQFPDADVVFVESGGRQPGRHLQPGAERPDHLRHRRRRRRERSRARAGPRHHQERSFLSSTKPIWPRMSAPTSRSWKPTPAAMRGASKPFVMSNLKTLAGVAEVVRFIEQRGMLTSGG